MHRSLDCAPESDVLASRKAALMAWAIIGQSIGTLRVDCPVETQRESGSFYERRRASALE